MVSENAMRDDDDALRGIDLAAWQPPPLPAGTADAVIARMREPAAASAVEPATRPSRRTLWLGGLALIAAAAVALTVLGVTRAPGDRGALVAARPGHLELGDSGADLDTGAELRWERERHRITAHQTRGTVRWTIGPEDTLVIESGEPGSAATIEASGASLRVEVQMNLSDARLLGVSALTAVAVSVVTIVVYEGHVKATSGGQTVNVTPGATVELLPGRPAPPPDEVHPDRPAEPVAVGAAARDASALEAELRAAREEIAQLKADLAARPVHDSPPPAPTPAPRERTAPAPAPAPAPRERTAPAPEVHYDRPPGPACDSLVIDDLISQAANQFAAGFAKSALSLVKRALECQTSVRMYRMAATYACAAHDLATAREMFEKVPVQFQSPIVQRCQLEGLDLGHR
jgi:hypothetical protein